MLHRLHLFHQHVTRRADHLTTRLAIGFRRRAEAAERRSHYTRRIARRFDDLVRQIEASNLPSAHKCAALHTVHATARAALREVRALRHPAQFPLPNPSSHELPAVHTLTVAHSQVPPDSPGTDSKCSCRPTTVTRSTPALTPCAFTCCSAASEPQQALRDARRTLARTDHTAWLDSFADDGRFLDPASGFWETLSGEVLDPAAGTWHAIAPTDCANLIDSRTPSSSSPSPTP